jgi:hypothetical protein
LNNPTVQLLFPTDDSKQSQSARLNAAAITLQNLNGPGKGCPVVSTTFGAQQRVINAGTNTPPALPTSVPTPVGNNVTAPPSGSGVSGTPDAATIESLAPSLGFKSGINPTGLKFYLA